MMIKMVYQMVGKIAATMWMVMIQIKSRIDTEVEIEYLENGGVLHYVLRNLAKA